MVTLCSGRGVELCPRLTGESRREAHEAAMARIRDHFARRSWMLRVCHRLEMEETATREPHAKTMLNGLIAAARAEYEAFCLSWRP